MKPNITSTEYFNLSLRERDNFTGIVVYENGNIIHLKKNKCHREDGPAIIWSAGHLEWAFEGLLHNLNGPAIIFPDGREEYWIHGNRTSKDAVALLRDLYKLKRID
jgi:hypothetical protein